MQFSPLSSTVINAMPDAFVSSIKIYSVLIFSLLNNSIDCLPKTSLPTFAMNVTSPFKRAAATAWLAPLPPAFIKKFPPKIVSPGAGKCAHLITISVLELPITTIIELILEATGFVFINSSSLIHQQQSLLHVPLKPCKLLKDSGRRLMPCMHHLLQKHFLPPIFDCA